MFLRLSLFIGEDKKWQIQLKYILEVKWIDQKLDGTHYEWWQSKNMAEHILYKDAMRYFHLFADKWLANIENNKRVDRTKQRK